MSRLHSHLYNRAAWKRLRARHLGASPLCRMHEALGMTVLANVVDHVRPHRGDEVAFFDGNNLQSLCKSCHDGHKQAQERQPDGLLRGAGQNGAPLDLAHPWYAQVLTKVGGVENLQLKAAKTALEPSFAKCQNRGGGASA